MTAEVYRAYDAADRLLYVGCSVNVEARLAYHADHSDWWLFHVRIERESFPSRKEALAAESAAIANEHPRWNMAGRSPEHPDGRASSSNASPWLDYERNVARRNRNLLQDEAALVRDVRRIRMALAGVKAEAELIRAGGEFIDEAIA